MTMLPRTKESGLGDSSSLEGTLSLGMNDLRLVLLLE